MHTGWRIERGKIINWPQTNQPSTLQRVENPRSYSIFLRRDSNSNIQSVLSSTATRLTSVAIGEGKRSAQHRIRSFGSNLKRRDRSRSARLYIRGKIFILSTALHYTCLATLRASLEGSQRRARRSRVAPPRTAPVAVALRVPHLNLSVCSAHSTPDDILNFAADPLPWRIYCRALGVPRPTRYYYALWWNYFLALLPLSCFLSWDEPHAHYPSGL